jgi:hypothetical protein
VELALQAEIAGGSGQWAVRSERNVEPGAVQLVTQHEFQQSDNPDMPLSS